MGLMIIRKATTEVKTLLQGWGAGRTDRSPTKMYGGNNKHVILEKLKSTSNRLISAWCEQGIQDRLSLDLTSSNTHKVSEVGSYMMKIVP